MPKKINFYMLQIKNKYFFFFFVRQYFFIYLFKKINVKTKKILKLLIFLQLKSYNYL